MRRTRGLVLIAMVALTVAAYSLPQAPLLSAQELAVSVDLAATPKGWVPVDYGNAQVSVPSSWTMGGDCGQSGAGLVLREEGRSNETWVCPNRDSGAVIDIYDDGAARPRGPMSIINGIKVYGSKGVWEVPSLGVDVSATGPEVLRILHTLTHSPRGFLLAPGPALAVPPSWRTVGYAGISVDVPGTWDQLSMSSFPCGGPIYFGTPEVFLDAGGTSTGICPGDIPVFRENDGVLIAETRSNGIPAKGAPCLRINGLSACPFTHSYGIVDFLVHVPHRPYPVFVEIGLAGNGMIGRTVLYSMRPG